MLTGDLRNGARSDSNEEGARGVRSLASEEEASTELRKSRTRLLRADKPLGASFVAYGASGELKRGGVCRVGSTEGWRSYDGDL